MSIEIRKIGCIVAALTISAAAARAETPFSASVHVATTGFGIEGQYKVNNWLAVRANGDWLSYGRDFSSGGIAYDGKATLSTGGVFADLHPLGSDFFVSGGAYFGDRKATLTGSPATNQTIDHMTLTPAQIGQLQGKGTLSSTAPFVGVGYDGGFRSKGGLFFKGLIGVAFSDDPDISLKATGPAAAIPGIQSYLNTYVQQEEGKVQHDAQLLKTYPVASIGLGWRF